MNFIAVLFFLNSFGQLDITSSIKSISISEKKHSESWPYSDSHNRYKTNILAAGLGLNYSFEDKVRLSFIAELSKFKYHVDFYNSRMSIYNHGTEYTGTSYTGEIKSNITSLQLSCNLSLPIIKSGIFNFVAGLGYSNNIKIRHTLLTGERTDFERYGVNPISATQYADYITTSETREFTPLNEYRYNQHSLYFNPGLEVRTVSEKKWNLGIFIFYSFSGRLVNWTPNYYGEGGFGIEGIGNRIYITYRIKTLPNKG